MLSVPYGEMCLNPGLAVANSNKTEYLYGVKDERIQDVDFSTFSMQRLLEYFFAGLMKRFTIVIVFIIPFLTSCWQSHLSRVSVSSDSDSCSVDSLVILYDHNLSIPLRETRRWFEFIPANGCSDTDYLLLRYRGGYVDTIALESRPGIIEIRDTIYRDSLVWYSVISQLAQSDSIWRTESALGIISYY